MQPERWTAYGRYCDLATKEERLSTYSDLRSGRPTDFSNFCDCGVYKAPSRPWCVYCEIDWEDQCSTWNKRTDR